MRIRWNLFSMKKICLLAAVLFFGFRAFAAGAEIDLDFAFNQLRGNGAVPFANALYQDPENAQRLIARMSPLLQGGGEFYSYEIVSRRFLTKKVERVVLALYFERFPVYLRVDFYDTFKGKICLPALVSRDATDVLPLEIISAAGK